MVRVLDVICTVGEPNSFVHPRVAHNAPVPAASLPRVQSNASILSVLPQVTEVHELRRNPAQLAGCSCNEGVHLSAVLVVSRFFALCPVPLSTRALLGRGRNTVRDGLVTSCSSLNVAYFNARQLWSRDGSCCRISTCTLGSTYCRSFSSLTMLMSCASRKFNASEFQFFLMDQDFSSEGPSSSFGPESGFLVSDAIACVIPLTEFRIPLPWGGAQ